MKQVPIIETRGLTKSFDGLVAVNNLSFSLTTKSLVSIIGPNGAGKTTFFNLLSGVLLPTKGQVFLKGQEITRYAPYKRARLGMGRSFQITNIFPHLTVLENVRLAAQSTGHDNWKFLSHYRGFRKYYDLAMDVLSQVRMEHRKDQLALYLPHGDKRKLEVAIVLARDPAIIMLDEPAAGISSEEIPEIMELIRSIQKKGARSLFLVEHRMDVVTTISDRIVVLAKGEILADGTPQEIMNNEEVQRSYLGGGL